MWNSIVDNWPLVVDAGAWLRLYWVRPISLILVMVAIINLAVGIKSERARSSLSNTALILFIGIQYVYVSQIHAITHETFHIWGLAAGPFYSFPDVLMTLFFIGYIGHTINAWRIAANKKAVSNAV